MPDVYAVITEVEPSVVEQVATAMEVSAGDPQQQAMVETYLGDLALPAGARGVLEVGRGGGERAGAGRIGPELATALKAEARRRVEANAFYGHVADTSLTAQKPA
jgi:hypothetical protein